MEQGLAASSVMNEPSMEERLYALKQQEAQGYKTLQRAATQQGQLFDTHFANKVYNPATESANIYEQDTVDKYSNTGSTGLHSFAIPKPIRVQR
jgi:hypothetical protein